MHWKTPMKSKQSVGFECGMFNMLVFCQFYDLHAEFYTEGSVPVLLRFINVFFKFIPVTIMAYRRKS